jgi:hypothetical protein
MRATGKVPMHRAALLAAALALGGCSGGVAAVQDPQTGQEVTCSEGTLGDWNPWSQRDACLADHVAQGWTVKMKAPE